MVQASFRRRLLSRTPAARSQRSGATCQPRNLSFAGASQQSIAATRREMRREIHLHQRHALCRRRKCRGTRSPHLPFHQPLRQRSVAHALHEARVVQNTGGNERSLRRSAGSACHHTRDRRQGGGLQHRPRPHHAQLRNSRGIRNGGGVQKTVYRRATLRRIHARRERQCGHRPRRRRGQDQETRRIRQTLSHQTRGGLSRQAGLRRSEVALRRSARRRNRRAHQV